MKYPIGIQTFFSDWEEKYGASKPDTPTGTRFTALLRRAMEQTGRRVVVLIDEYDKPILDVMDSPMEEKNRSVLKAFYSTFKAADEYLQFVLLTGVTKFSQVSIFSGFNQPLDISMDARYETNCGISQEEVESYFAEPIAQIFFRLPCRCTNAAAHDLPKRRPHHQRVQPPDKCLPVGFSQQRGAPRHAHQLSQRLLAHTHHPCKLMDNGLHLKPNLPFIRHISHFCTFE